ncbi:6-phosphofructokinase [Umbelopsis sp. AD052]|nr:6-phosphofructokinase [Umbelopsis sp. AD052]
MSDGLSHVVLNAPSVGAFDQALSFYCSVGFQIVTDTKDSEESIMGKLAWLSMFSDGDNRDLTIRLKLNPATSTKEVVSTDVDYTLEDIVLVIATSNLPKIEQVLAESSKHCQKHEIQSDDKKSVSREIYTVDPLGNVIAFTNKASPFSSSLLDRYHPKHEGVPPTIELASRHFGQRKKIGVLTSGGDAPGMNACVRAVVRYGITKGCDIFAIYEGYQGLVDGGSFIKKMEWKDVRGWLAVGGTSIGTARCMPFKTREGRLQAAQNLISNGIDALIVCGGDGSLTGADVFRSEWPGLLKELKENGRVSQEECDKFQHLTIVGLVGSIDNDMSSTDITIGAVTSLHRICESVDSISSTALSHSRAFVVEVMGRHCGWLALMAGIATGADFVFIPERPPSEDDWEQVMCDVAQRHRHLGKRKTVIIVAEGAIDKNLNAIKADYIKDILTDKLGLDTRVTTLGHTQRGGSPAAYDRILATIQSVEAVEAVLRATPDSPSPLIGTSNNKITCGPLMKAVELTHAVAEAISQKNFARAMELRDPQFADEYDSYIASTIIDDQTMRLPEHQQMRIAILHVGAPAGGMNAATRTIVRYALNRGHTPLGVFNGFPGLLRGTIEELTWLSVDGWTSRGGSELGTNRSQPDVDMGMVAYQLQKHSIQGLILIGGFEAYSALLSLEKARDKYPSLRIPLCQIPATISNNVPGTDFSLGTDTSLNAIVDSCDAIVQSARSSRRRVFVVEVQGGKTGYLAVEAGLATGANTIYIPEEGISLARLQADVQHLIALYNDDDEEKSEGRIILRTESVSKTYTTDVICNILQDEGHNIFDSRTAVLGHIQQGGTPSPMDRIRATRLAVKSVEFVELHASAAFTEAHENGKCQPIELTHAKESAAVIGIMGTDVKFTPIEDLLGETDMKNRKSQKAWWYEHRPLVDLLSGRGLFASREQDERENRKE